MTVTLAERQKELGWKWQWCFQLCPVHACVCICLESRCATMQLLPFRVAEHPPPHTHTHTRLYTFLFLFRMAGARVWSNRWLAGYRCVWLKAVRGWAY